MNLLHATPAPLEDDRPQSLEKPRPDSTVFMTSDGRNTEPGRQTSLDAHDDARAIVRLVQCPNCSLPFRLPVTLPCGHTYCRQCLPQPHPRANISYPNTPERREGITCPSLGCGREHPLVECCVDVTLTKVLECVERVISKSRPDTEDTPTYLEEMVQQDNAEKRSPRRTGKLHGGRLVSTFTFAQRGELDVDADVAYHSMSPAGDDYRELDRLVLDRLHETAQKELDCHVCYNVMCDPVTSPCGHTFCRRCLTRVMDHSTLCAVCRRPLTIPPNLSGYPSNGRLNEILNGFCPEVVAARQDVVAAEEYGGSGELDTPLFVCTLAFPEMPCFLHIFEPRYRLMIRRAVESNGQFGMLVYNRTGSSQGELGPTPFLEYGTMLRIDNLQMLPDGRSIVETRGLYPFRVRAHGVLDGYTVGRIERVGDVSLAEEERLEVEQIRNAGAQPQPPQAQHDTIFGYSINHDRLPIPQDLNVLSTREMLQIGMAFVAKMRASSAPWLHQRILQAYGEPPDDPAKFPYWFANVLPISDEEKYTLLPTTSVRERLRITVGWIQRVERQRW